MKSLTIQVFFLPPRYKTWHLLPPMHAEMSGKAVKNYMQDAEAAGTRLVGDHLRCVPLLPTHHPPVHSPYSCI